MARKALRKEDVKLEHSFLIDVAGTCNLKCPSCPVGSFTGTDRPKGLMSAETFRRVRDKILAMHGNNVKISLYNWGEATLNPDLPAMLKMCYEVGIWVDISTNLNIHPRLRVEDIFEYPPGLITISTSGFRKSTYEFSHRNGRIESFMRNFWAFADASKRMRAEVPIWVNFHLYKHNVQDLHLARFLCEEAGFTFKPTPATFMAIEKLISGEFSAADREIMDQMLHTVDEFFDLAERIDAQAPKTDCKLRRQETVINHDLSVPVCCGTYNTPVIFEDFLDPEVNHRTLYQRKYSAEICGPCMAKKIHVTCEWDFHNAHIMECEDKIHDVRQSRNKRAAG